MTAAIVVIDGHNLSLRSVVDVARDGARVSLDAEALDRIVQSRSFVEELVAQQKPVYGITTGFGKFSDVFISVEDTAQLQYNLICSHACGVGEPLPREDVRAMMLLRANALALGNSGVRPQVVQTLIDCLNAGVDPIIPRKGSLGASGDLVPLAHMGLFMTGGGEARLEGEVLPAADALARCKLTLLKLEAKEGLALVNGTQFMTARGSLLTALALELADVADLIAALTCQALEGIPDAFSELIHQVRPHPGQLASAANMRQLLKGSQLTTKPGDKRTQDAYTLRCIPQVHGASRDAITHVATVLHCEINAASDNPLIFPEANQVISGGNFHGQPVALALDYLAIALAELANISERRIERLVNPGLSGLPPFLTDKGGLNSGMMIAQYTAAALVSENKVLSHPASVDSIPSSGNQEDHVSMGAISANKAWQIADNLLNVMAIELMCACQGVDFRGAEKLSPGTREVYKLVREHVPFMESDRVMSGDIQRLSRLIKSGAIGILAKAKE